LGHVAQKFADGRIAIALNIVCVLALQAVAQRFQEAPALGVEFRVADPAAAVAAGFPNPDFSSWRR
jgi:hypothetical protein